MMYGLFLVLLTLTPSNGQSHEYDMARDTTFVGWDDFEEKKSHMWTNVEECELARESCYRMRDCKEDWACLGELKYEPSSIEQSLDIEEDNPDHSHDMHPCVQLVHYCYGINKSLFKRVINQRIYWQYSFEHNLNQA